MPGGRVSDRAASLLKFRFLAPFEKQKDTAERSANMFIKAFAHTIRDIPEPVLSDARMKQVQALSGEIPAVNLQAHREYFSPEQGKYPSELRT